MVINGVGLAYYIGYNPAESNGSALTKAVFPYGGYIRWKYADGVYSGSGVTQKEVILRFTFVNGSTESAAYWRRGALHVVGPLPG